ncbi:MAG: hypothetical protein DRZ82_04065 [Thermoprotei archaeon]|mgnify:CR=1 FL=1|nr:MAG: hypothetical protein DRZ82_04065 [Thermoprotei archaeon]
MDDAHILETMEKFNLDSDNVLNYHIVKKYKMKGIVSFDKYFDRMDIKRLEPMNTLRIRET